VQADGIEFVDISVKHYKVISLSFSYTELLTKSYKKKKCYASYHAMARTAKDIFKNI